MGVKIRKPWPLDNRAALFIPIFRQCDQLWLCTPHVGGTMRIAGFQGTCGAGGCPAGSSGSSWTTSLRPAGGCQGAAGPKGDLARARRLVRQMISLVLSTRQICRKTQASLRRKSTLEPNHWRYEPSYPLRNLQRESAAPASILENGGSLMGAQIKDSQRRFLTKFNALPAHRYHQRFLVASLARL